MDTHGFTVPEMLVVVLVVAVLAAIAIPAFLGQRERAFEATVVSDLRNAGAAQAYRVMGGDEPADWVAQLEDVGFLVSDRVAFTNDGSFTAHASGLCIEATHEALAPRTWRFAADGDANPTEGGC
ncbi:MAG: prepilin-type N-terminal cleavage/methylation domain-containing protein [Nitriliruptoraceae bacterium]|nr:prepilin-type N-terminal cleavage/methylation domain-containing protein [Nitriliruptoraceae bacterium]